MHMWWPCDCCPLIAFCVFSVSCWYLLDRFFPQVKFGQRQQPKDSQNAEFMDWFSFSNSIPFLFDWVYLVAEFLCGHGELVIFAYPETSVALDSNLHSTSSLWSHVLRLLVLCKRTVLSLSRHHFSKGGKGMTQSLCWGIGTWCTCTTTSHKHKIIHMGRKLKKHIRCNKWAAIPTTPLPKGRSSAFLHTVLHTAGHKYQRCVELREILGGSR